MPPTRLRLCAALLLAPALPAAAQSAFHTYGQSYRTVAMPANPPGSTQLVGDALPDGRMLLVSGLSVLRESAVGSGLFETVGILDSAAMGGGTDAAFLRISPDGQRIAVGGGFNRPVAVFDTSVLPPSGLPVVIGPGLGSFFNAAHYDAAWADNSRLAITAGAAAALSQVTLLDTLSDPAAPTSRVIVSNIGGASGGIAFDSAGRLYTGNGFDFAPGGSSTGTIRVFERSATVDGAAPADFELGGVLLGEVLSASSMLFDLEGNLVVGGGDFGDSDTGYLGVISAGAIAGVLGGGGVLDPSDPMSLRRLTPTADPFAFYGSAYNGATGELYATMGDFATGTNTWFATVPGPGAGAMMIVAAGVLVGRRRRA